MQHRILQLVLALVVSSLVAGFYESAYGAEPAAAIEALPTEWLKTELFFGANLPGGRQIAKWAWADFMDEVLTRHFPQGLTVYEAYGQMQRGDGRIEKQSTWVVVLLHPKDSAIDRSVQDVIDAFRKQFAQAQAVRLTTPISAAQFYAD